MTFPEFLDVSLLPKGIQTLPLKLSLDDPHIGSALVRFTLDTRHVATDIPLNERKSYRINLEWLVVSVKRDRPIGILTQSDHSYRHPDLVLELPLDSELVLVPASPYLCNAAPVVSAEIHTLSLGPHAYRYVLEVGASTDSSIIGNNWSYREGRLAFEHWFHNKMFRWSFDEAELVIPAARGCAMWVGLNALCRTGVDVFVGDAKVGHLHPISDWARWHDEFYGFSVPAALVDGNRLRLTFRYTGANDSLIDFNLRQSYFAVSRLSADIFGEPDPGLTGRVMAAGWDSHALVLEPDPTKTRPPGAIVTQAAIVVPQVEFDLLDTFFAPHSAFWTTLRGASKGFEDAGVSVAVVAAPTLRADAYDTLILGPLRFLADDAERACAGRETCRGAIFSMTTASLAGIGVAVDDSLLGTLAYKEIFNVPLPSGQRGNFWEFTLVESVFAQAVLAWGGSVVLGRTQGSDRLWLVSASAEEAIEMGDPHAAEVLACFVREVAGIAFGLAGDAPCTFRLVGRDLEMRVAEQQVGLRSYGGGIARGWPAIESEVPLFSGKRRAIRFIRDRVPQRGSVASALRERIGDFEGLKLAGGSKLLIALEEWRVED